VTYSLSNKLVGLVVLSCVVPASLVGALAYRHITKQNRIFASTLVESVAETQAHQIQNWLTEQGATAEAVARSNELVQYWEERNRFRDQPNSAAYYEALYQLHRILGQFDQAVSSITEMRLIEGEADVFLSNAPSRGYGRVDLPDPELTDWLARPDGPFGPLVLSPVASQWVVNPVRRGEKLLGHLASRVDLDVAGDMFLKETGNLSVEILLVTQEGRLVSTNRPRSSGGSQWVPADEDGNTLANSSSRGLIGYRDFEGRPVWGAWQGVQGTHLVVLAQIRKDAFDSTLRLTENALKGVLLLLALVFSLPAFVLARTLLRPLRKLTRAAGALAEGQRQVVVELEDQDEVGVLGATFDRMSARLASTMEALEAARDEALEAYRAKGRFMANMTHELRTPLTAIIGYSEMLIGDAEESGQPQWVEDLEVIRKAGRHLLTMINSILDLSKLEAGKLNADVETFELGELLQEVQQLVVPLVKEKNNQLELAGLWQGEVAQDRLKLRQILLNLLSNAAKFTEAGKIELGCEVGEERMRFWVRDTGIGMTPEQCRHVFEEFAQADDTTTRKYGGTGLGLTLVRRFADLLGGTIEVDSEKGRGTTFILEVPRYLSS